MTLSLLEMQLGWLDTLKTSGVGFVIVLIVLAFIAVLIMMISKTFNAVAGKTSTDKTSVAETSVSKPVAASAVASVPVAPVATSGYLRLEGVSEANAAVIMALVSHQTGIPLNRLAFHSIKCLQDSVELVDVDEPTAAVIMAIVSDTSGIPLERLDFSSIKLIKEN